MFDFGETFGPAPLEVGDYDVQIFYLGEPVPELGGTVNIEEDVSKTAVAHLDVDGNIAPLSLFVNQTTPLRRLFARLQIHHLAAAPTVDASVRKGWRSRWPRFELSELSNGDKATAIDFPLGWYNVGLLANDDEVFNTGPIRLLPGDNFGVYAVGVFPDSFTLVYLPFH
jgi:hypothetical protein